MSSPSRQTESALLRAQALKILEMDDEEVRKLPSKQKKSTKMCRTLAAAYLCGCAAIEEFETEKLVAQCDAEFATIYDRPGTASTKGSQFPGGRSALSSGGHSALSTWGKSGKL